MKLLKEVNGASMIVWMIRRLKLATVLDEIVICTSTNPQDDPLEEIAKQEGIRCFRGSEGDVAARLDAAIDEYNLDYALNVTGDCPMVPFDLIQDMVDLYKESNADFMHTYQLPIGILFLGIKPKALKELIERKASNETEYWPFYFLKTDIFHVIQMEPDLQYNRQYRVVLDYPEDFQMFKGLYEGLGYDAYAKSTQEVLNWLDDNPIIASLNDHCGPMALEKANNDPISKVKLKDGREF